MKPYINKINKYLVREFIFKLAQSILIFSILIFFVNLFDALDQAKSANAPAHIAIYMSFLQIGGFINDINSSLILIAALITFSKFSQNSEITIIRVSGYSIFSILKPILITSFIIGILWIIAIKPIIITMQKKYNYIEQTYIKKEVRDLITHKNGIWLRQENKANKGEIIIKAQGVYQENIELKNAKFLFFDNNNIFYKRIDAKTAKLNDKNWILGNAIINDQQNINKKIDNLSIKTDLQKKFIKEKIINNFQDVKLFSIFELPSIIKNMEISGFSSTKFKVYFHSSLAQPILFISMTILACFFGIEHNRNNKRSLKIFLGLITGLIIYIFIAIIENIGSSGLMSSVKSTWYPAILISAISVILIYRKN